MKDSTWDDAFTVVGYAISLNWWIFLVKQVHIIIYWSILSFIGLFQVVGGAFCRWMEDRDLVLKYAHNLPIGSIVFLYILFMFVHFVSFGWRQDTIGIVTITSFKSQ